MSSSELFKHSSFNPNFFKLSLKLCFDLPSFPSSSFAYVNGRNALTLEANYSQLLHCVASFGLLLCSTDVLCAKSPCNTLIHTPKRQLFPPVYKQKKPFCVDKTA